MRLTGKARSGLLTANASHEEGRLCLSLPDGEKWKSADAARAERMPPSKFVCVTGLVPGNDALGANLRPDDWLVNPSHASVASILSQPVFRFLGLFGQGAF